MNEKIEEIYRKSIELFKKCSLPNGAIIASDVFNYPKDVKWYGYVWPRDASYICYACDLVGLHEIPRNFFKWCLNYPEDLKESKIFLAHKYYPNGRIAGDSDISIKNSDFKSKKLKEISRMYRKMKLFYIQTQYDHTASVLWAIYEHSKFEDVSEFKGMIKTMANGLSNHWNRECFKLPNYDLWEEKAADPKFKQVHTYTLAMCIKGLECASLILKQKRWNKTIQQMKNILEKCYVNYFVKTYGKKLDKTVDSSALGLVWPTQQFSANDERIKRTVEKILGKNEINGGIHRYSNDKYDGKIKFGDLELRGGGAWPLLNFWISIYFSLKGDREKALKYFNWVVERIEDKIPEQIKNNKPISINPLAWSHAMFIISGKFLGLF